MTENWQNKLYYGDNLIWLRNHEHFPSESVDLIYLDPPFNSKADYNVIFTEPGGAKKSQAQVQAFDDTWNWDKEVSAEAISELDKLSLPIAELVSWLGQGNKTLKSLGAYIAMMSVRLIELHRVLKSTGSLYLHCDPTASHYLKMVLDQIFGPDNFRNEIIWRRTGWNSAAKRFGPLHQTIFYYGKSNATWFQPVYSPYTKGYIAEYFTESDEQGRYRPVLLTGSGKRQGDSGKPWRNYDPSSSVRHWAIPNYMNKKYFEITGQELPKFAFLVRLDELDRVGLIHWGKSNGGGVPNYKYSLQDAPGVPLQDIWAYQPGTEGCVYDKPEQSIDQDVKWLSTRDKERLNYPTQKPEGLLERIIKASSKEGDLVLDPFCGCGTTVAVAQRLNRRWIGIDVTWIAIDLVEKKRLLATYGESLKGTYLVKGNPTDNESAEALAKKNKKEFELWAISLVPDAGPREHDGGVDGVLGFQEHNRRVRKVVIQVKGGETITPSIVRDLIGTVEKENAAIGLLITLRKPTSGMQELATHAGKYVYHTPLWEKEYFRIQIRTIAELLEGKTFDLPSGESPVKKSERLKPKNGKML